MASIGKGQLFPFMMASAETQQPLHFFFLWHYQIGEIQLDLDVLGFCDCKVGKGSILSTRKQEFENRKEIGLRKNFLKTWQYQSMGEYTHTELKLHVENQGKEIKSHVPLPSTSIFDLHDWRNTCDILSKSPFYSRKSEKNKFDS